MTFFHEQPTGWMLSVRQQEKTTEGLTTTECPFPHVPSYRYIDRLQSFRMHSLTAVSGLTGATSESRTFYGSAYEY